MASCHSFLSVGFCILIGIAGNQDGSGVFFLCGLAKPDYEILEGNLIFLPSSFLFFLDCFDKLGYEILVGFPSFLRDAIDSLDLHLYCSQFINDKLETNDVSLMIQTVSIYYQQNHRESFSIEIFRSNKSILMKGKWHLCGDGTNLLSPW